MTKLPASFGDNFMRPGPLAHLDSLTSEPLKAELDPGIYVEPKDKGEASENARQAAFVALMKKTAPGCRVVAIPNGTHIGSYAGRAKVKREGLSTGFPDTCIVWPGCVAFIEFKAARSNPKPAQVETLNWLYRRDHAVAVCRTAQGAVEWLKRLGAPIGVVAF